jgi:hypothetical protein
MAVRVNVAAAEAAADAAADAASKENKSET